MIDVSALRVISAIASLRTRGGFTPGVLVRRAVGWPASIDKEDDVARFQDGEAVTRAFFDRWNRGDAEGLGELFVEDADFVNVVGLWWRDRRAIRKAHAYGFERIFRNATLQLVELKVRELSPDVHIVHTVSTLDGQTGPDGGSTGTRVAVISVVAHRRDDGFRIVSCQNTDRVAGADTHVVDADGFRPVSYRNGR